jgi:hypothetical protein
LLAFKNKNEKYNVDQTMVKDREIIKDTSHCDMQKRIDEADLKIASVSRKSLFQCFSTGFLKT